MKAQSELFVDGLPNHTPYFLGLLLRFLEMHNL
jgi:hypothetical protein